MIKDYSSTLEAIRKGLSDYLTANQNIKTLVLGVSGGMDSAIIAAIAKPVCDKLNIPLIGRSLPIETNKPDENERARNIGIEFCTNFAEHDLTTSFFNIKNLDDLDVNSVDASETKFHKIKFGNMKARIRMIYMYNLAYKNRGIVLSTDNFTEYSLGFSTIMGDWGDFGMIQYLWKSEVYDLAEWMCDNELSGNAREALYSCINCNATDGLGISNTDLDQLIPGWVGTSRDGYKKVDEILQLWTSRHELGDMQKMVIENPFKDNPVIKRHINSDFKRKWPVTLKRDNILK